MHIRPVCLESDSVRIVDLINLDEPAPITVTQFQQWCQHMPPGRIARRMAAVDAQDQVMGYGMVTHEPSAPAHDFYVWVTVDPHWRRQGIGSALYADALAFLHSQSATNFKSEVRDDSPDSLRFAQQRGFAIDRHHFESTLDLAAFDETPYPAVFATLAAAGIRFFSLADVHDSPAARRDLYELNRSTALDVPGADSDYWPFEEFEHWICGAEWYRPEGQLVAADGDTWIGLAAVRLVPQTQGAYNLFTGVLRPYRGRKIALALKLKAIRYARQHGARTLRANNDSLNAPMLAINRKLGYCSQPGKYILRGISQEEA